MLRQTFHSHHRSRQDAPRSLVRTPAKVENSGVSEEVGEEKTTLCVPRLRGMTQRDSGTTGLGSCSAAFVRWRGGALLAGGSWVAEWQPLHSSTGRLLTFTVSWLRSARTYLLPACWSHANCGRSNFMTNSLPASRPVTLVHASTTRTPTLHHETVEKHHVGAHRQRGPPGERGRAVGTQRQRSGRAQSVCAPTKKLVVVWRCTHSIVRIRNPFTHAQHRVSPHTYLARIQLRR